MDDGDEEVVEGYLEKTGKYFGKLGNTAWRKRWCKLLKKQKQLLYYDDNQKNTKQYKDKVDLNIVTAITRIESSNHPFSFSLVTPDRRYKFACKSAAEREVWFDAVSSCIRGKQEQTFRDKQVLLELLSPFSTYPKPKKKGKLARPAVEIPDWVWHEVSDFMGNLKAP